MGRLILIGIVVLLVVWLLKRALAGPRSEKPQQQPGELKGDLVSCARCGVNLPQGEARSDGGRYYCSEEHRRLGPQDG